MNTNEVKSKFIYPDKLYARTNDNITLDISYAPQTLKAVEYTRTDAFIEKACKWLRNNSHNYANNALGKEYLVNDFKNYMEGE